MSAFAHSATATAPLAVNHQGLFPAVTISFNLQPGVALGDAVDAINAAASKVGLPATIQTGFAGTAQAYQDSLGSEPLLIAAALAAVYIVLGMLYESYIHPITILSTLPSAGVGALLALVLTHTDLSMIAMIGIILLIGIVKKNAILMIDFALAAERNEGKKLARRDLRSLPAALPPILMTTMAALLGALPLALGTGTGSELRRPLGITIIGGLIVSQMLTLYTTPVVYLYFDRLQHWRERSAPSAVSRRRHPGMTSPWARRCNGRDHHVYYHCLIRQSDSRTLAIGGNVSQDALPEIARLIDHGRRDHETVMLDMGEVTFMNRPRRNFSPSSFKRGIALVNCPGYIGHWILQEKTMNQKIMFVPQRAAVAPLLLLASGCMVGPNYKRPPAPVPPASKRNPPDGWKEAQPSDAAIKGKWWEIYNDPKLNALEEQVNISNQNVLTAEAQYRAARAEVQIARSALFPTLTAGPTRGWRKARAEFRPIR